MEIRAGYEIAFQCFQETPMVLMLSIEPARVKDLLSEHRIRFSPDVEPHDYVDMFGNTCTRIVAPPAQIRTGPIRAYGSHLGCLTAKRLSGHG